MKVRVLGKRWKTPSDMYHCVEFAAAGQDAIIVVFMFVYLIAGNHT
jgi:hypothetical protein